MSGWTTLRFFECSPFFRRNLLRKSKRKTKKIIVSALSKNSGRDAHLLFVHFTIVPRGVLTSFFSTRVRATNFARKGENARNPTHRLQIHGSENLRQRKCKIISRLNEKNKQTNQKILKINSSFIPNTQLFVKCIV